ncbi:hypothetical protein ACLB2K_013283 [Fragaria x ananassa]
MKRKRDAREAAAGRREEDVDNGSLYICAVEEYGDLFSRYRVQAIKLSDLFSFPDTISPITIYPAGSKSKDNNSSVLREVALLDGGDDVPYAMGFCVFRSQITLAGGWFLSPDPKICSAPKPSYVLDTTASEPRFISSKIPGIERPRMPRPWLREIEGKLYALSTENFAVLDLITKKWCRLKSLPFPCEHFSFSFLGTKIFATHTRSRVTYCFDVTYSVTWAKIGDLFRFEGARNYHNNTLVLDTEDDSEKLMFIFGYSKILVHLILHQPGKPYAFEPVASIDFPEFPCLSECDEDLSSYSSAHLGDRKVCFSLLYWNAAYVRCLLVLPLEFAYSKSGADFSCTSDQKIPIWVVALCCNSHHLLWILVERQSGLDPINLEYEFEYWSQYLRPGNWSK